jgi:hypothetical protein
MVGLEGFLQVFYNFPSLKATSQVFLGAAAFIAIKKR